jgi:hypothetical protein
VGKTTLPYELTATQAMLREHADFPILLVPPWHVAAC